ncbi:hypothetical protein IKD57_04320 [Candidatus Saccharibacteria bacterium]|nr:hypothetical protein [Candidatus Saccharibacteria bacterium]
MQKSDSNPTVAHRRILSSTTLNRKYVKKPDMTTKKIDMASVKVRMNKRTATPAEPKKLTAKELKERAIAKALANAAKEDTTTEKKSNKKVAKIHFGIGRILLALSCATAAVFAIVYFVNLNMPDISLKVAAMQTGIEASYPSYVPRDYSLSDIVSEDGRIVLNFTHSNNGGAFSITEEKSAWDSNALYANFVKDEYGENYIIVREQGLTIYISGSNAAWVNGGIVYRLKTTSGSLTKKQICSIAVSL